MPPSNMLSQKSNTVEHGRSGLLSGLGNSIQSVVDVKVKELFTRWLNQSTTKESVQDALLALKNGVWTPPLEGHTQPTTPTDSNGIIRRDTGRLPPRSISASPESFESGGSHLLTPGSQSRTNASRKRQKSPLRSAMSPPGWDSPDSFENKSRTSPLQSKIPVMPKAKTKSKAKSKAGQPRTQPHTNSAAGPAVDNVKHSEASVKHLRGLGKQIPNLFSLMAVPTNPFGGNSLTPSIRAFFRDQHHHHHHHHHKQQQQQRQRKHGGDGGDDDDAQMLPRNHCDVLAECCGFPRYCGSILFDAAIADAGHQEQHAEAISAKDFLTYWQKMSKKFTSLSDAIGFVIGNGETPLCPAHFRKLIQRVLDVHPGLQFLKNEDGPSSGFGDRYVDTVIARLFYESGQIVSESLSPAVFRRCGFVEALWDLEHEEDINKARRFFSYDHFYVLYTTFWKFDVENALKISQTSLSSYNDDGLCQLALDRVFQTVIECKPSNDMAYFDFVGFMMAEEDKTCAVSIEYWFKCLDLDHDGVISLYEMEQFYNQQSARLNLLAAECLPFRDFVCMLIDIAAPICDTKITVRDLKRCKQPKLFINALTNVNKYLDYEERDAFEAQAERTRNEGKNLLTDWDKFAFKQYDVLSNEAELNQSQNGEEWESY